MPHTRILAILLIAFATLAARCADLPPQTAPATTTSPAAPSIEIAGKVQHPRTWTPEQLKAQFDKSIKTIKYTLKDANHTAVALPLVDVLTTAAAQVDPKIKNHQLRFVVVVEGRDGYIATFALVELLPDIGNREAWLTLDMDGKPLSDRDAPMSLIVPGDAKPERWVHGIKSIRLVDIGEAK